MIIIPYTLAITTGSMISHSMRTLQRPDLAIAFSQIITVSTTALCFVCNMLVYLNKEQIVSLFTENLEVTFIAKDAFVSFIIAFSFDWLNQCASGMVKGAGWQ